jgi:TRIAD3 protein (E3 ubiquitin-protein ligase RNF216)
MHSSSCPLPFPESELRRVLTEKLMSLYERVVQQKEVAEAGLEGLEECPWCEWKCVMEVGKEVDRLFRCGNEEGGCGVVSCRFCWKKDHLPKSCKEVEEDKKLDGRHAIEEAMSTFLFCFIQPFLG